MTTPMHEGRPPVDDEISLWEVLAVLLRRRWTIVLTTVFATALVVTFTLLRDPTFTTQASFRPQGSEASNSQLMALAGQFGINIPGMGREEVSPAFYAELITSREILFRLVTQEYDVEGVGRASLAELFEIEIEDADERLLLRETIETLRDNVLSVQTGRETGVVTVEVRTDWPDLSFEIARRLLDEHHPVKVRHANAHHEHRLAVQSRALAHFR